MEEEIDKILLANFTDGDWQTARKQLLDLFVVMQRNEQVCSKCGGIKVCEWCNPFNQPIQPEGIVL